jgi:2-polyprenyl-6-hydroxyphenyl methylase/3-demethylubiquinone-9 3-methyltransferase
MWTFSRVKNWLRVLIDPELRELRRVINKTLATNQIFSKHDQIFIQRLHATPMALKMIFWKKHFEWKVIKNYPEIHGNILDFGCGAGHSDILLARQGYKVHGIDLSPVGIAIASYFKSKQNNSVRDLVSFEITDVSMSLNNQLLFDSAWSSHVFEHIEDPVPVLKGLKNWLNPGAYMLISVPTGYAYDDPDHVNHFHNSEDITCFLEPHVKVVKIDISQENQVIRALCKFT